MLMLMLMFDVCGGCGVPLNMVGLRPGALHLSIFYCLFGGNIETAASDYQRTTLLHTRLE